MKTAIAIIDAQPECIKFWIYEVKAGVKATPSCTGELSSIGATARFHVVDTMGTCLIEHADMDVDYQGAIAVVLEFLRTVDVDIGMAAVGHRIVQGDEGYSRTEILDREVLDELFSTVPSGRRHGLMLMQELMDAYPDLPQVAVFDSGDAPCGDLKIYNHVVKALVPGGHGGKNHRPDMR